MAATKPLNARNLESLGAARLAELLIEISMGDAAAKRRLRLALIGNESQAELGREVGKWLAAIARSRSFVDWQKRKELIDDLEMQRRAIVEQVAKVDSAQALDLMWRFLALANPVFGRCDDSSGAVISTFHVAVGDLGALAEAVGMDPEALARRTFNALTQNDYGQYDHLIEVLTPALGRAGLEHLKQLVIKYSEEPLPRSDPEDRRVVSWGTGGPVYANDYADRRRDGVVRRALQQIADARGDVDGYIAQQSEKARSVPKVAAEMAQRLLAVGRTDEAWTAINAISEGRPGWIPIEWEETRIDILEALGRPQEAQAFRWVCFERSLRAAHLKAYLKLLPDFEDVEAEERGLSLALTYPNVHQALMFLVSWPALDKAAELVLRRANELNGDHYEVLTPAADALSAKHPLAATLVLRAMIDFSLKGGRATRYRHAARHLLDCTSLSASIKDFGAFEAHETYVARLKTEHGKKSSFWNLVS
jgi:hypothetical protein